MECFKVDLCCVLCVCVSVCVAHELNLDIYLSLMQRTHGAKANVLYYAVCQFFCSYIKTPLKTLRSFSLLNLGYATNKKI